MQKILILANSSGGLYDFRNSFVKELLKKYEVTICVPDEVKTDLLREEGCRHINIPINRRGVDPVEDIKLYLAYKKLLKRIQPDLVFTYTIKPNIYGGYACRRAKIPYITTITGLGTTFQKAGVLRRLIVMMYQIGIKKAECVIFQNNQNKNIFEHFRIKGKSARLVQGSGVDLIAHKFEKYPQDDEIRFLFIARIMKEKGIDEFLEAAEKLHNDKIQFQILGACDEDYQDILEEYQARGVVKLFGFQTEVHPYIKAASAVVLPTYHEGMSNVLMEASATGRPIIATDISGCREIFEEGITGFGCKPQNSESLLLALQKFIGLSGEERAEMGRLARIKMEQEFDRILVTDVYINEVNHVLTTGKKD